jgi:hypothetical protein
MTGARAAHVCIQSLLKPALLTPFAGRLFGGTYVQSYLQSTRTTVLLLLVLLSQHRHTACLTYRLHSARLILLQTDYKGATKPVGALQKSYISRKLRTVVACCVAMLVGYLPVEGTHCSAAVLENSLHVPQIFCQLGAAEMRG